MAAKNTQVEHTPTNSPGMNHAPAHSYAWRGCRAQWCSTQQSLRNGPRTLVELHFCTTSQQFSRLLIILDLSCQISIFYESSLQFVVRMLGEALNHSVLPRLRLVHCAVVQSVFVATFIVHSCHNYWLIGNDLTLNLVFFLFNQRLVGNRAETSFWSQYDFKSIVKRAH